MWRKERKRSSFLHSQFRRVCFPLFSSWSEIGISSNQDPEVLPSSHCARGLRQTTLLSRTFTNLHGTYGSALWRISWVIDKMTFIWRIRKPSAKSIIKWQRPSGLLCWVREGKAVFRETWTGATRLELPSWRESEGEGTALSAVAPPWCMISLIPSFA